MRVLAALALALLLAGCVQTSTTSSTGPSGTPPTLDVGNGSGMGTNAGTDWAAKIVGDHGGVFETHRHWENHTGLSTPNFIELAHDPLGIAAFEGATAGGYFCGGQASTDAGQHITVISSFDTSVAFVVVDSTDPLHPIHLGDYILDNAQTYDVDVTPDGKHVAVAADLGPQQPPPGSVASDLLAARGTAVLHASFRDGCTGEVRSLGPDQTVAAGPSTILVSLADPKAPAFEDLVPSPVLGPHSVSTALINGHTYVAASITNLVHQASYYQFFEVTTVPAVPGVAGPGKLVLLSVFDAAQYGATAAVNGHVDAEISLHPVTKQAVVYISDWDGGLIVLDFSIPQLPRLLSQWQDTGADSGAVHSTRSLDGVYDGHHYLLVGQEFVGHPVNRPSGWIYILDDTDPANVKEVGRWTLPVDVEQDWHGVELFSTHYFRVLNDTVFVAMYHGGVWAFKLDFAHPEALATPRSVGAFVPDQNAPRGRVANDGYEYAPFVLDVFPYPDGTLVIYDGLSGVYVVQYDSSKDMPSPTPWPREGKTL